jgi:hypothetical protein
LRAGLASIFFARNKKMDSKNKDQNGTLFDRDIAVVETGFPSGIRDFEILRWHNANTLVGLNPIHLLFSETALDVLDRVGAIDPRIGTTFAISRMLVQCLEYSRNARHLIVEPWGESDLNGEELRESTRSLARECSSHQAERFRLVMTQNEPFDAPYEDIYWGTFSTLPRVEDSFDDPELGKFAAQLFNALWGEEQVERGFVTDIKSMRSKLKALRKKYFVDFDLATRTRQRRKLLGKLMSVAVRQSSTLIWQIAFSLVQKRQSTSLELTELEAKLFEIRYGAYEPLGKINIGFLHDCDSLHAELVNELASSIVTAPDKISAAEDRLLRHVKLLNELRDIRKHIRSDQKTTSRNARASELSEPKEWVSDFVDNKTPSPKAASEIDERIAEYKSILHRLKPADRARAQAYIDAGGDRTRAAALLDLSREQYNQQLRQTTKKNVERERKKLDQSQGN